MALIDDGEMPSLLTEYPTRAGIAVIPLPDGEKLLATVHPNVYWLRLFH
ncbi:hypothetical protein [Sodalis ligni]|nr:hypothetical protein [Sodalis ligni]